MTATIYGSSPVDPRYVNYRQSYNPYPIGPSLPGYVQGTANRVPISRPQVLGASTGPAPAPQPSALDVLGQNTRSIYDEQLDRARSLYDQRASELNNQLAGLGREKDSLLDRIGSTYRGLTQSAQDTLTKNLGLLEGRKGEVNQQYDTSRTNVARLLGDEQRTNRQLARAQNLLGSSFYTNLQSKAGRTATERIAGLNTEETSKLDAIGGAILNAQTDTNTKIQALKEEQANAEREVLGKYQTMADAIRNDLRFNERDRLDALDAVNTRLASALDNIGLTFLQYRTLAGNLGNTASTKLTDIQSYDPFSAIQNTLDTNNAFTSAYNPLGTSSAFGSGAGQATSPATGYYDFERGRPRSLLDLILAG